MYKNILQITKDFNVVRTGFDLNYRQNDMTGCTTTIPTDEYQRLIINNERARKMLEDSRLKLSRIHHIAAVDFANYVKSRLYEENIKMIKDIEAIEELEEAEVLDKYCYSDIDSVSDLQEISLGKYFRIIEDEEMYEIIKMVIYQKFTEFKNISEEQKDGTNEE
jgi:hypothetical protein